jgi:hypothetical protein
MCSVKAPLGFKPEPPGPSDSFKGGPRRFAPATPDTPSHEAPRHSLRDARPVRSDGGFDRLAMHPRRDEKRSATAVAVMLTSRDRVSTTELTLTENVSGRGARVVTKTLWSANDSLVIKSLEGDLQSEARVIYRQSVRENVYAIGLELIAPTGTWRAKSTELNSHGRT